MASLLLLVLFASLTLVSSQRCGNEDDYSQKQLPTQTSIRHVLRQTEVNDVDVYFHVASTESNLNKITDQIVSNQFDVLRAGFLPYGFSLSLVNTSRIVDDTIGRGFYVNGTINNFDGYKAHLSATRRGRYDALNVYFFTDLPDSLGGQCNLPQQTTEGSESFYLDGCVVNGNTMPGLKRDTIVEPPPKGHTAIHEVGHWFGLLHTFQGRRCDNVNDNVADTPVTQMSTGCRVGSDTCPDSPGLDPIQNYMGYNDDSCTNEFTAGQQARMHLFFDLWRKT